MLQVPWTSGNFGWLVRIPGSPHGDPLFFLREPLDVCETLLLCPSTRIPVVVDDPIKNGGMERGFCYY